MAKMKVHMLDRRDPGPVREGGMQPDCGVAHHRLCEDEVTTDIAKVTCKACLRVYPSSGIETVTFRGVRVGSIR